MAQLSYLGFHLLFVLPPLLLLGYLVVSREGTWWGPKPLGGLAVIVLLAVLYTTPWDNMLIARGVWDYGEDATLLTFWHAPLGEYLFFALQPVLAALWLFLFPGIRDVSLRISPAKRLAGVLAGLGASLAGLLVLALLPGKGLYLGTTLAWAGPVLAIQWGFGWPYLWALRRTVAVAVLVPTLYLWAADRIALELGIWVISAEHTVGLSLVGLPIEEMLFFFITNLFIVQGLILYMWLLDRLEAGTVATEETPAAWSEPDVDR